MFDYCHNGKDKPWAYCIGCEGIFAFNNSTTSLSHYLCNSMPCKEKLSEEGRAQLAEDHSRKQCSSNSFSATSFRQTTLDDIKKPPNRHDIEKLNLAVLNAVIDCDLPFEVVSKESFRNLLKAANASKTVHYEPHVVKPPALKELLAEEYELCIRKIHKYLVTVDALAFTTDTATTIAGQSMQAVTAHFIDENWQLC